MASPAPETASSNQTRSMLRLQMELFSEAKAHWDAPHRQVFCQVGMYMHQQQMMLCLIISEEVLRNLNQQFTLSRVREHMLARAADVVGWTEESRGAPPPGRHQSLFSNGPPAAHHTECAFILAFSQENPGFFVFLPVETTCILGFLFPL